MRLVALEVVDVYLVGGAGAIPPPILLNPAPRSPSPDPLHRNMPVPRKLTRHRETQPPLLAALQLC